MASTNAYSVWCGSVDDLQPWFRAFKYMLNERNSRDIWHNPKYSELLEIQQAGFNAYVKSHNDDPQHVLEYIACKQQIVMHQGGYTATAPPSHCYNVSLK